MFQGLSECPLFWYVSLSTIVIQVLIMFVPGLRTVFAIYTCTPHNDATTGIDYCNGVT